MEIDENECHDEQWASIMSTHRTDFIEYWIRPNFQKAKVVDFMGMEWPHDTPLRILMLLSPREQEDGSAGTFLEALYPMSADGAAVRLVIEEMQPWANGFEGRLRARFADGDGRSFVFFDTRFYRNAERYTVGMEADFNLSGLAMKAWVGHEEMVHIPEETTLRGQSFLIRWDKFPEDTYVFRGPVIGVATFDMGKRKIVTLSIKTLRYATVDGNIADVVLPVHVDSEKWGNNERPMPGADAQGFLWLHGYLLE